jgi:Dockerin type I domain
MKFRLLTRPVFSWHGRRVQRSRDRADRGTAQRATSWQRALRSLSAGRLLSAPLILIALATTAQSASAASASATPSITTSVTQNWTNDPGGYIKNYGCFGVDDNANWSGYGTLAPGQTYTFVPSYPTCQTSESPAISMHIDWTGATQLSMTAVNPFYYQYFYPAHLNQLTVAPVMAAKNGQQANLCLINVETPTSAPTPWSVTVTNTGSQTATVNLNGQETNGWPSFYYPNCIRSDAAHDFWNDGLRAVKTVMSGAVSDYLFAGPGLETTGSTTATSSPADVNGDGVIDQTDVNLVAAHVGEGSGYGFNSYDPNGSHPNNNASEIYDIDGDGQITQHDVAQVQALVGKPLPLDKDYLAPWAVITSSPTTVAGSSYQAHAQAFASDNYLLAYVDFYVNGKLICTDWNGTSAYGGNGTPSNPNNMFSCPWQTPKRAGATTNLKVVAYDGSGMSYSTSQTITTQ